MMLACTMTSERRGIPPLLPFNLRVRLEFACQSPLPSNFLHAIARYWNCLVGDLSPSVIYFLNRACLPACLPAYLPTYLYLPGWLAGWLAGCPVDGLPASPTHHVTAPRYPHTCTRAYVHAHVHTHAVRCHAEFPNGSESRSAISIFCFTRDVSRLLSAENYSNDPE